MLETLKSLLSNELKMVKDFVSFIKVFGCAFVTVIHRKSEILVSSSLSYSTTKSVKK